jgi:superfamily II DNA or RNA helicase
VSRVKLFEIQEQALAAEDAHRAEHPEQNRLAIVLPTGTGKTTLFSERARRFLDENSKPGGPWPLFGNRVLILVHTDELTDQAEKRARFMCEPYTVGVVKADRDEVDADVIVASVQTLSVPGRKERITDVGYVIVDEVQYGVTPMWTAILEHFRCIVREYPCPPVPRRPTPMLGVTATLARSDGQGFGDLIHEAVYTRSTSWAIRKGYLIDVIPYTIKIPEIDAGASDARLDAQLADSIAPEAVVRAWTEQAWQYRVDTKIQGEPGQYPSTVLFAPLVKSAQAFADAFNAAGVKAEVVHGAMPKAERRAVLERYEAGVTTVVCNAMALMVGWDSPRTMCVVWARPIRKIGNQAPPIFIQGLGRGMRVWLSPEAPPREEQRCVVFCVSDGSVGLANVADLSDHPGDVTDGVSLTAMEDEWDLGRDIEPDGTPYAGPVVVERWDAAVQASSKAWKYTAGGIPFLPTAKRGEGYVFVVEQPEEGVHVRGWEVWLRRRAAPGEMRGHWRVAMLATAPDLELAMSLAEDAAHDHGGDIGRLLADKNRPWRKAVPSAEMIEYGRSLGLSRELERILASKAGGKAGKLSDLIDKVVASRTLDPVAKKIKERVK